MHTGHIYLDSEKYGEVYKIGLGILQTINLDMFELSSNLLDFLNPTKPTPNGLKLTGECPTHAMCFMNIFGEYLKEVKTKHVGLIQYA